MSKLYNDKLISLKNRLKRARINHKRLLILISRMRSAKLEGNASAYADLCQEIRYFGRVACGSVRRGLGNW